MAIPLTILCLIFLAATLAAERLQARWLGYLAKPAASLCFVLVTVTGTAIVDGPLRAWIVAGLVLGMAGDVFLMLPSRRSFLVGLVAFLLGHLAYVVACALLVGPGAWASPWSLLPLAAAAAVTRWLWPALRGKNASMRGPVLAYIAVISSMVVAALAVLRVDGPLDAGHRWTLFLGALLFFLSDIAVARSRFVAPGFGNRAWGLPTYYAGQLLFAWSAIAWA